MNITPGTLCYLVNVSEDFLGRVVEVVTPGVDLGDGTGSWHQVDAPWARAMYPGQECFAQRENLLPIAGPRRDERSTRTSRQFQGAS